MFRKILDRGEAGDNVGLLLRGVDKKEIKRGMVLAKPGSITPHTKIKAEVYVLKKEEGGRHTPFHNKYRPQFYVRTLDITGEITLPEGTEMVMPGDNVTITVDLIYPVAINVGLRFAIREGGRTVGAGTGNCRFLNNSFGYTGSVRDCIVTLPLYTGVAQLVEHWSPKPGVGSSSLSSRAKIISTMNIKGYFQESFTELVHKVTWPTWSELQNSAVLSYGCFTDNCSYCCCNGFFFSRIMEFIYSLLY